MKWVIGASIAISVFSSAVANPKIAAHAVSPITQQHYPKLYALWGKAGVRQINSLMPKAAQRAAKMPGCDKVDMVSFSSQRSVPGQRITFFVDRLNRKRFSIEGSDLP